LPSYSPHLNPDEYLNNNLKYEMAKKGYSKDADEVQNKATSVMRSFQQSSTRVECFFENENVKYAKYDNDDERLNWWNNIDVVRVPDIDTAVS
jgi:hypothetical protein